MAQPRGRRGRLYVRGFLRNGSYGTAVTSKNENGNARPARPEGSACPRLKPMPILKVACHHFDLAGQAYTLDIGVTSYQLNKAYPLSDRFPP